MASPLELITENTPLAQYSHFRFGGPARWFAEPAADDDILALVQYANAKHWPIALLGSGANTIISDQGYPGLVIHLRNDDFEIAGETVACGAAVTLRSFLSRSARAGLGEELLFRLLAGVPGTIGGSLYGNAGGQVAATGERRALGDFISAVTIISSNLNAVQVLSRNECFFGYRSSRFKQSHEIILRAQFLLPHADTTQLLAAMRSAVLAKNKTQPTGDSSAGCIFANIPIKDPQTLPDELKPFIRHGYLSAWRAVAAAGCQGKAIGGAQVSPVHANFIINNGSATAEQVVMLISYIKQQVRDKLGLQLHEEVQYLGF